MRSLGELPYVLLFVVPSVAAYFTWRNGGRRSWLWTEWAGVGTAALLGSRWLLDYYLGSYQEPPTGWISARIATAAALVVAVLLSAQIVLRSAWTNALPIITTRSS